MKESSQAFSKTRADHAMEITEDYVEEIAKLIEQKGSCRVVDLANRFGVNHVSVIQVIQRLKTKDLVESQPYGPLTLTEKGVAMAEDCAERHDIVRRFLLKLGVGEHTAQLDSEGMEHHLSRETLDRMQEFLEQE